MSHLSIAPRTRRDLAIVAGLALLLVGVFLWPLASTEFPVPVGPDVPVYLWWARVGAAEGLSMVGDRPGAPALIATVASTLGLGLVPAVAGLQYGLGPAVGLAAAALVRGRGEAGGIAWAIAGLLTGVWAVHLGSGYLANLAFVACFLAAGAALARRTRRGTLAAIVLLAGGGLAHPQFFLVGATILLLAAGWSFLRDRRVSWHSDAGRAVISVGAAGAAVGIGLVSMLLGPRPLLGDTSKDAFLRRAGQWATLREAYLERFGRNPGRYGLWVAAPLAALGGSVGRGFTRRFLLAWATLTVVALPIGVVTSWFPPDRTLTFAFCVPMLAAMGIIRLGARLPRVIAVILGAGLVVAIAWPALASWHGQRGFLSPGELADAAVAGRIAATTPPGTTLVFVASDADNSGLFASSHALNVARATVPPDRVREVRVYIGDAAALLDGLPTRRGDRLFDLASELSLDDIPRSRHYEVFVLADFARDPGAFDDPRLIRWAPGLASTVPDPRPLPPGAGEIVASSASEMATATLRVVALLIVVGFGWARWAMGSTPSAAAIAPAFGAAVLVIVAIAAERLGVPLDGAGAVAISAFAGGLGYALLLAGRHGGGGHSEVILEGEAEVEAPA